MAYQNIILILLLIGCSSSKTTNSVITPEIEPSWLYSPQDGCSENELCASGEGSVFAESDANSKKSLASIFETKINAEFNFTKHSFSNAELVEMREYINTEINEQVQGILKGVSIKERFKKDGLSFSLAFLNKKTVSQILKAELGRMDNKLMHFYNMRNRLFLKKMNVLFNQRNVLNEKLIIVETKGRSIPITFSHINAIKYKSIGGEKITIRVLNSMPKYILKKIEEQLSDIGYKIVTKKNDYFLNLSYKRVEEYLKVKGFKKYTFTINVETKNNIGKKLGSFSVIDVVNGRNEKDAFLKAKEKLLEQFESKFEKLNFK
jgi:hypothetical protein